MKNKVGFYTITTTYVGTLFGAGFVSGQELLQFFAVYPDKALFGIIILAFMVFIFSFMVMHSSYLRQPNSFEQVIVGENKILKLFVNCTFLFFSAGVLVIMFAGAGALFNSILGLPNIIGSILLCLLVIFIGLKDTSGIMNTFKILTPIMFVIAIITALLGINLEVGSIPLIDHGPLKFTWWFSAILYMTYNFYLEIGLLSPMGKNAKSTKEIFKGALCSALILGVICYAVVFSIIHNIESVHNVEMPMLEISKNISPLMNNVYAFVLFGGLVSASIGMLFAILNYIDGSNNTKIKNRKLTIPILCLVALSLSSLGFSSLISIVYPILGYFGLLALVGVTINYIINIKKYKTNKQ
ncbi:MAG: hypothetical protein RR425_03920 [Erysipelotrichales bacterium]